MKLEKLFQALKGHVVGGKMLYHEYPGVLAWSGPGKWRVFATPDYEERGTIPVEASTEDGDSISGPELRYKAPLTPEQYLRLVRPYVETDPRQWGRSDNPAWAKVFG